METVSEATTVEVLTRIDVAYDQALTASVMAGINFFHPDDFKALHKAVDTLGRLASALHQ